MMTTVSACGPVKRDKPLTPRQREFLAAMVRLAREKGRPATLRDLCDAMGFVHDMTNAAQCHLVALRKRGYVRQEEGGGGRWVVVGLEVRVADTPEGERLKAAIGEVAK
jgi:SOS-response transcriptional repressor LexA